MNLAAALRALAELSSDREFVLRWQAGRDATALVAYLERRGMARDDAMVLAMAYAIGIDHACDLFDRALDRAEVMRAALAIVDKS